MLAAIEARNGALAEPEAVPMREREIVDAVRIGIHPSRGDLVQQRLPQVRGAAIDQRDLGPAPLAQRFPEARRERQAAGATADDQDAMQAATRPGAIGSGVHRALPSSLTTRSATRTRSARADRENPLPASRP